MEPKIFVSLSWTVKRDVCCMQLQGPLQAQQLDGLLQMGFTFAPQVLILDMSDLESQQYIFAQQHEVSDLQWLYGALKRFEPWQLKNGVLFSPAPAQTRMNTILDAICNSRQDLAVA